MYNFIDTTEVSDGMVLPSEALKINGEYIENIIDGYRTLNVSGREALSPELTTYETGVRDGSRVQNKRFPARIITVTYKLSCDSNSAFREAYNALGAALNVDDATLIFNDENDKFYIGTPSALGEVEAGRNSIVSSFEIYCADPFKYSVAEYEVEPIDGIFTIDYNGTYKSYPKLEADFFAEDDEGTLTGGGDCGFVAFFNDNEKILQFGDPDEVDTESYAKSQTLIMNKFTSWGSSMQDKWVLNNAYNPWDSRVQVGTLAIKSDETSSKNKMIAPSSYGSGSKWHGPSITRQIPADAAGDVGATNFTLSYRQRFCMTKNKKNEYGAFYAKCVHNNGSSKKTICAVQIFKSKSGNKGTVNFYVNGVKKKTVNIDLSRTNKRTGYANKKSILTTTIKKSGSTVSFNVCGLKYTFKDSAIANILTTEITFGFDAYGTKTPVATNGLYWAKFIKNNCDTFEDIPNKFSANDVLSVDCKEGKVYLNDLETPSLGALGNDWEDFCLISGINQIGTTYSDWVDADKAPTYKLRYREVFL